MITLDPSSRFYRPRHEHSSHAQASSLGLQWGSETKVPAKGIFCSHCHAYISLAKHYLDIINLQTLGKMQEAVY